jgi:uncharacterized membrane protein YbhN (UPF0104 family)
MPNAWKRFAQFVHTRIGWNRIGFVASAAVLCFAGYTLFRMLRGIEPDRVFAAISAMPAGHIALSALFVAGAYVTLTFYDFFSLRTIGARHVPYRIAAMAAFTSYSIGHNLGATVFTGGAIRFRIYSAYGLSIVDVAKIAFVTGLTFWLGNAFVLGLGVAISPEAASALDRLPPIVNQALGVAVLIAISSYLLWLLGGARRIGIRGVNVDLPNAPLTLVQILIGMLDLGLSALGMYMLLPAQPPADLLPFVVIFVLATLLGFISHTPGALGVFDAAILIALSQFAREDLLATLLVFRVIYYVVPFTLALCVMATRELWLANRGAPTPPANRKPARHQT